MVVTICGCVFVVVKAAAVAGRGCASSTSIITRKTSAAWYIATTTRIKATAAASTLRAATEEDRITICMIHTFSIKVVSFTCDCDFPETCHYRWDCSHLAPPQLVPHCHSVPAAVAAADDDDLLWAMRNLDDLVHESRRHDGCPHHHHHRQIDNHCGSSVPGYLGWICSYNHLV